MRKPDLWVMTMLIMFFASIFLLYVADKWFSVETFGVGVSASSIVKNIKENSESSGFCGLGDPKKINEACNASTTKEMCGLSKCCVYAGNSKTKAYKCVAGSITGADRVGGEELPTYDHYYYMNTKYDVK